MPKSSVGFDPLCPQHLKEPNCQLSHNAVTIGGILSTVLQHGKLPTFQLSQNHFDNESKKNMNALTASEIRSVVLWQGIQPSYQLSQNHYDNESKKNIKALFAIGIRSIVL